jgi:hypothetical protein
LFQLHDNQRHNKVAAKGLHRDSIAEILKTAATRAGIDATNIAGHSVRAGMATQAALNGSSERAIAKNHPAQIPSRFAALHPAGRAVPRECVGKSRPLVIWSREMTSYQVPAPLLSKRQP